MNKEDRKTKSLEEELDLMRTVASTLHKERNELYKSMAAILREAATASAAARRTAELLERYQLWDADNLDALREDDSVGGAYRWSIEKGWHRANGK